jgi:hypothetical protein
MCTSKSQPASEQPTEKAKRTMRFQFHISANTYSGSMESGQCIALLLSLTGPTCGSDSSEKILCLESQQHIGGHTENENY